MQEQSQLSYPANTGPHANLSEQEKKKRLDIMARLWQSDIEKRVAKDGYRAFMSLAGLDEYRYSIWLRFPEWDRSAVVGQVLTLRPSESGAPEDPAIFTSWRHEPLLKTLADWKDQLSNEHVFNISVRITPGGLGEGIKWAVVMPEEFIPRYRPAWPTQQGWVRWTRSFDWLAVAIPFIHKMLAELR